MKSDLFTNKTTRHFRNVIAHAFHHTTASGVPLVTPLHLLYALCEETGSIGEEIMRRSNIRKETISHLLAHLNFAPTTLPPQLSPESKRAIEKSVSIAALGSHTYIGTEHLLFGIIDALAPEVGQLLKNENIKRKDLTQQLEVALKSAGKLPEMLSQIWEPSKTKQIWKGTHDKQSKQKMPALEFFGVELTNPTHAAKIDPVVGRDSEIERVIHVLARRTKNNPLLLGDPGVGKTAIVEGLAKRMVAGDVPPSLLGKRIFAIDLGLMIAGTMYRGEFESRIKQLVDEVKINQDIILFIDEIHSIVGAGSSNGTLDAANLLKPALARGELHVIGATTFDEFKKHIEHDAALERRFQSVAVREPSPEETTEMLFHIKSHYEQFHNILVGPDTIDAAVKLAHKYFPEKRFPDKAIDLLDEAMSAVKIKTTDVTSAELQNQLRHALKEFEIKKQEAILKENFDEAQTLKKTEIKTAERLATLSETERTAEPRGTVTAQDIYAVVSRMLRRPITEQTAQIETPTIHSLLSSRIFGQPEAIDIVTHAITRSQLGLHEENRPLASFLFVGPSGVGKTELAKLIAQYTYNDVHALIKFDMTEFSEGFSVSKIMGSPAGYVGYREGTTLVDRLRRQPMSVLLFDEIDKAHPDILNILLQMLEEGRITDASGKEASVKQSIIILTYQIAPEEITGSQFGFASSASSRASEAIRSTLFNTLKPELINRIDNVCVFRPLDHESLVSIATVQLINFSDRLMKRFITLSWTPEIPEFLAKISANPKEGSRKVRHTIEKSVEHTLVAHLSHNPTTSQYRIVLKDGILTTEPMTNDLRKAVFTKTKTVRARVKTR